jgi:hypothetical protein
MEKIDLQNFKKYYFNDDGNMTFARVGHVNAVIQEVNTTNQKLDAKITTPQNLVTGGSVVWNGSQFVSEVVTPGGGVGLEGSTYVFVAANGSPVENGIELKEKYELAKTMRAQTYIYTYAVSNVVENAGIYSVFFTNNNALSNFYYRSTNIIINGVTYTVNIVSISASTGLQIQGLPPGLSFTSLGLIVESYPRITVVLAPGDYDLEGEPFLINASYVDVVTLTGNTDANFIDFGNNQAAVHIDSNFVLVKGLNVGGGKITIGVNNQYFVVEKCIGGYGSFSANVNTGYIGGTFNDCIGGDYSFAGANMFVSLSATFNNCVGGNSSFSPVQASIQGIFNNCTALDNSFGSAQSATQANYGTFNNCKAGSSSFRAFGMYAVMRNCKAQMGSYAWSYGDPTMYNCEGGDYCFNTFDYTNLNGTFNTCTALYGSFGYGSSCNVYATLINCSAREDSFAGGINAVFAGRAINCLGLSRSFGGNSSSSNSTRITGKIINCQLLNGTFLSNTYFDSQGQLAGCFDNSGFIASRTM